MTLGTRITRRQHHFLMVLAYHHQAMRTTYWPTRKSLAEYARTDESEIKRMIRECKLLGILDTEPGDGRGNRTDYKFLELETGAGSPPFKIEKGGLKGGLKGGKNGTPNKVLPNTYYKVTGDDGLGSDSDLEGDVREKGIPVSSSVIFDDDTGELSRIIRAFESNPVTKGKTSAADKAMARRLLLKYSVEEIELGILLGSARKAQSASTNVSEDTLGASSDISGQIKSLSYFVDVIHEVAGIKTNYNSDYVRYLQHVLARLGAKKEPQSESVVG